MKKRIDQLFLALLTFSALCMFLPWLKYRLKMSVPFAVMLLWVISTLMRGRAVDVQWRRYSGAFKWCLFSLALYSFLPEMFVLFGHASHLPYRIFAPVLLKGIMLFVPYFSFKYGKIREYKIVSAIVLVAYCITGLLSFRTSMAFGGLEFSRILTSENPLDEWNDVDIYTAKAGGVGNYDYVYTAALLFPLLLLMLCNLKSEHGFMKHRLLLLVSMWAMFYIIKTGGLGTPVFVLGAGCLLIPIAAFTKKVRRIRIVGLSLSIVLLLFMYFPLIFSPFAGVFKGMGSLFPEGSIRTRFETVAESFSGDKNAYAYKRYGLQRLSMEAFLSAPVFGIGEFSAESRSRISSRSRLRGSEMLGGHSMFLDRLGGLGIVGIVPYVMYFVFLMKFYARLPCDQLGRNWMVYPTIFMCTMIFTSIANPFHTFFEITYFIPGFALLFCPRREQFHWELYRRW